MKSTSDRVAFFLPLLVGAGAERVILNLAQGFVRKGLKVDFVLGKAEGPFLNQVPKEARLVDLKASRVLTSLPGLVRFLRDERPRALISASDHANIVALWAKYLAGVKTRTVVTLHTTISKRKKPTGIALKSRIYPRLIRLFYPLADQLVAVSRGVGEDYSQTIRMPNSRISVIYNPVITDDLLEKAKEPLMHPWFRPNEPPVILSVGRLSEPKNFSMLIRAFVKVREKCPARLLILGEGELRHQLEALISQLNLNEDVSLPGFVMNPYNYMASAAVFVLSSIREGLPTVLIEALALGSSVVSTNCRSGPDEILMGGTLGKLVPVDNIPALAEAIVDCLNNEIISVKKESLKRYELDWAVNEYLKIVEGESRG